MQRRRFIQAAGACRWRRSRARPPLTVPSYMPARRRCTKRRARKDVRLFDTGPEWANWKALFREFKQRYPDIELTYNDLGSAATVVALKDAATPAGRHRLLLRGLGGRRGAQGSGGAFPPVGFEQLPEVFREAEGRWFTVHTLNIAFLVNRKLVARAPEGGPTCRRNTGTL